MAAARAPHVLGNGELRDLITEEAEFGLDRAPAPGRVLAVPREDCRRPDDEKAGPPARPQLHEPEPEGAVASTKSRATDGSLQDGQLMTQGDVLQADGGGTAEESKGETSRRRA
jgi:hypothetical protein